MDETRILQELSHLDMDDNSDPEHDYCSYCREVKMFLSWKCTILFVNCFDTVQDNVRCLTCQPMELLVEEYKQLQVAFSNSPEKRFVYSLNA